MKSQGSCKNKTLLNGRNEYEGDKQRYRQNSSKILSRTNKNQKEEEDATSRNRFMELIKMCEVIGKRYKRTQQFDIVSLECTDETIESVMRKPRQVTSSSRSFRLDLPQITQKPFLENDSDQQKSPCSKRSTNQKHLVHRSTKSSLNHQSYMKNIQKTPYQKQKSNRSVKTYNQNLDLESTNDNKKERHEQYHKERSITNFTACKTIKLKRKSNSIKKYEKVAQKSLHCQLSKNLQKISLNKPKIKINVLKLMSAPNNKKLTKQVNVNPKNRSCCFTSRQKSQEGKIKNPQFLVCERERQVYSSISCYNY